VTVSWYCYNHFTASWTVSGTTWDYLGKQHNMEIQYWWKTRKIKCGLL